MNINYYKNVTDRIEPSEQCRERVLNMSKRENKINHKINKKAIAVIVVAAVIGCGGTSVFAARYTDVFSKLINREQSIATKGDIVNYEPIAKNAKVLDEPVQNVSTDISAAIDSIYCDGNNVTLAITASLANGNPDKFEEIAFDTTLTIGDKSYSTLNREDCEYTWLMGNLILDNGTENNFTGSINLTLRDGCKITESDNAKLTMSNISCGNGLGDRKKIDDDVILEFELVPDLSIVKSAAYTIEEDGFVVNIHEITPAKITCTTAYPSEYTSTFYDEYGNEIQYSGIVVTCYDEDGNEIPYLNTDDKKDGLPVGLLTGTENNVITFKFVDKNEGLKCLKELTIDFSKIS